MKYIAPGTVVMESGASGSGGSGFGNDWANALENYNKAAALTRPPAAWLNIKIGIVVLYNYIFNSDESSRERDMHKRARIENAIPYFVRASQLNTNNKLAYQWLGYLYYEKADYQSAIQAYTDVLRIDPKDALALHNRGVLFQDARDYSRAIADYTEALNIDANSSDTKWYLDVAVRSRSEN
jgi:tetratricopeptide (TPR) repeat protein